MSTPATPATPAEKKNVATRGRASQIRDVPAIPFLVRHNLT